MSDGPQNVRLLYLYCPRATRPQVLPCLLGVVGSAVSWVLRCWVPSQLECAGYKPRGRDREGTPHQLYRLSLLLSNWRRSGSAPRSSRITELLTFCQPPHSFGHQPEVLAIGQNKDIQVNLELYSVPQLSLHIKFSVFHGEKKIEVCTRFNFLIYSY